MGAFKIVFTARAETDLAEAVRFIARRSGSEIAERVGLNLLDKALTLSTFPERGRIVPEVKSPAVREIFYKTYRIVYRIKEESVQVLRFWHAARGAPEIDSDDFHRG